ncbi:hypothetical protein [Octadecabacter sp. SW4]|uniref:hypothetical protein n=1 Tax=Octadecabacter sp. SW4 TaxID=2602067 RepID=UPI00155A1300|nr:hypothetical protein [Octadecabacter sp. SW4]|tara:strand:+ start:1449 stop:1604 length:156 start_codon:yes stop_codon:yes gene_type:complete
MITGNFTTIAMENHAATLRLAPLPVDLVGETIEEVAATQADRDLCALQAAE